MRQRHILLLCAALGTAIVGAGCGKTDWRTTEAWYSPLPEGFDRNQLTKLDAQNVAAVRPEQLNTALAKLSGKPVVMLTDEELRSLAPEGLKPKAEAKPYLVRGLSLEMDASARQCSVSEGADTLLAGCGALSHSDPAPKHFALIVYLKQAPRKVYVTFSVAE